MTKSRMPVVVAAVACAIAVVALVLVFRQGSEIEALRAQLAEQPAPAPQALAPEPGGAREQRPQADTATRHRLAALETRIEALERRGPHTTKLVKRIRSGNTAKSVPQKVEEASDEIHALREDVDTLLTGGALEGPGAEKMMDSLFEKARDKEWARHMKARAEFEEEWLGKFATDAGLSDKQLADMKALAKYRRDSEVRIWKPVKRGDKSVAEGRREAEELGKELETRLGQILDEEQRAAFQAAMKDLEKKD